MLRVVGDAPFERVEGQRLAPAGREQRVGRAAGAFGGPDPQHRDGAGGERGDAVLAALAVAADVRAGTEVHISAGQRGQLGGPQPGLGGQQDQGVVTATGPGAAVRAGQQGVEFGLGEVGDQGPVGSFRRYRQDPVDVVGVFGVAQRGEPEQGVDRGEAGVAGAGAVAAVVFEVVEERRDQRRVEVGDVESAGALPVRCAVNTISSRSVLR